MEWLYILHNFIQNSHSIISIYSTLRNKSLILEVRIFLSNLKSTTEC